MSMAITLLRKAGFSATIAAAVAFSSTAPATTLGLTDAPLFLAAGAPPNLIMAIDDSGSMDFEVLFPGNDGSAWWRSGTPGTCGSTDNNSFTGCINNATGSSDIPAPGRLNFNNAGDANGTWKKYAYLFPNGSGNDTSARRRADDAANDHFAIPPIPAYAWARSSAHNAAYFNPSSTYLPWVEVEGAGYTFGNANPAATRYDPVFEPAVTIDLRSDYAGEGNANTATTCSNLTNNRTDNYYFKIYRGMTLPVGTCFRAAAYPNGNNPPNDIAPNWQQVRTGDCQVGVTDGCLTRQGNNNRTFTLPTDGRVAIRYFPATFYLSATQQLPAGYGFTGTALTGGKAPDGASLIGYEIKPANFATTAQYNAAIQNFANWFQYYRKRHQALRAGLGQSFSDVTGVRVNGFTINNRLNVTMTSIDDADAKAALYRKFYTEWVRSGGTPNRTAVAKIIENFRRTNSNPPVTAACQKNFGMLFTDGFSNSPTTGDGIPATNVDGDQGTPYADGYGGSLADAAMSAYLGVRGDLDAGKVGVARGCPSPGVNYSGPLDCNRNPHMNFYAVTLGARGLLFNPDLVVNPYTTPQVWPTNFPPRHPSAVDDLWHATINGRGQLLNARSPQEISDKLKAVLRSIVDKTSTASAAALNSGSITSNSVIYQARFSSSDWTGQLLSYRIDPTNGQLIPNSVRDASDVLPAPADRKIFTRRSNGQAAPFTWAELDDDLTRVQQLDPNRNAVEAERMLNYLRGDASNELRGDATDEGQNRYRARKDLTGPNKLGDIVSSAPLFVGAPAFRYRDSLETARYSEFVNTHKDRAAMVYVGANDGMLHAFYASGDNRGREAFAYIPGAVFPKLRELASPNYGHQFYVDGSPSMGDAFFARGGVGAGAWRTVLAGGLNKGGQGVYAIDVTDPEAVNAASMLFEFTDANDVDLGFTYSQPIIAKLRDNNWYVIFGNGYNSMLADGRASTRGNAVLFLVNLATGDVTKIDTGVGFNAASGIPYGNGMATPSVADVDGDRVIDFVYAGDLYGNMWKFDFTSTSRASWGVAFGGEPLFNARNDAGGVQPITVRPEIARGPNGNGQMVLFGTGKYLETTDKNRTPQVIQSFYGIVDRNAPVTYGGARAPTLTKQEIIREVTVTRQNRTTGAEFTTEVRVTTDRQAIGSQGWYMDLMSPANGYEAEKQVTNPIVRDGRVIFATLIPDQDVCGFGGSSWLMELDLLDGSRLSQSPFDLNRDGLFTNEDKVAESGDAGAEDVAGSGYKSEEGILQGPGVGNGEFGTEGRGTPVQYKYLPGSSGNIQIIIENPGVGGTGRQSWRQIR